MGFAHLGTMLQFGPRRAELPERNTRMFAAQVMPKRRPWGATRERAPAAVAE